jgi:putative oxidoreductase
MPRLDGCDGATRRFVDFWSVPMYPNMSYFSPSPTLKSFALSVIRAVSGFTLLLHGLSHVFGLFGTTNRPGHAAAAFTLTWFAGVLELLGGALLVMGLFTRPVAFVLSGELAVAYVLAHASKGILPIINGGELALLYSFLFLYLAFVGGGMVSLDQVLQHGHTNKGPLPAPLTDVTQSN